MKGKKILIIAALLFIFMSSLFAKITVLEGEDNLAVLGNAEKAYIYVTYNGTKIYDALIDDYIAGIKEEGFTLVREEIIEDFEYEIESKAARLGKDWDMEFIKDKSQAKEGLLLVLNYDALIPIPAVGYNGLATVTAYDAQKQDTSLVKLEIHTFTTMGIWLPRASFGKNGMYFMRQLTRFMKKAYKDN